MHLYRVTEPYTRGIQCPSIEEALDALADGVDEQFHVERKDLEVFFGGRWVRVDLLSPATLEKLEGWVEWDA